MKACEAKKIAENFKNNGFDHIIGLIKNEAEKGNLQMDFKYNISNMVFKKLKQYGYCIIEYEYGGFKITWY